MANTIYFISHPEVVIRADVPVTQWPLSEKGVSRMQQSLTLDWVQDVSAVYCSTEQKAIDGARIIAEYLGLGFTTVAELGENDRSATGYLVPDEFERTATRFFNNPELSIRGWEKAVDAQARIMQAVARIDTEEISDGAIAIVSHGAVGSLLFCALTDKTIDRRWDQPGSGGGNYLVLKLSPVKQCSEWQSLT